MFYVCSLDLENVLSVSGGRGQPSSGGVGAEIERLIMLSSSSIFKGLKTNTDKLVITL